jgi:hypothetical protein
MLRDARRMTGVSLPRTTRPPRPPRMPRTPRVPRVAWLVLLASSTLGTRASAQGTPTSAASAVDACIQASEDTQRERAKGHLRSARARSAACLDGRCPTPIRRDCDVQATELARLMPTVVFRVRAPDGTDVPGARVEVDGVVEPSALDGRAHEIDPGTHEVSATAAGYVPARTRIVVEEGVRARVVELRPAPRDASGASGASSDSPAPSSPTSARASSTWIATGALAGVGVIGIGLFAGLGLSADADYRRLRDTCADACDPRDADSVRTRFQVADVALGVGLVALASAVVVYLVGPRRDDAASVTRTPTSRR